MKGGKTSLCLVVVLCTFPESSGFLRRGDSFRHRRKRRGLGMKWDSLLRGNARGTSGCDNSQRGVSEGAPLATFASSLSVNLPVHLSVCHTEAQKNDKLHLQKKHVPHVLSGEGKTAPRTQHARSVISLLFDFFLFFFFISF